MPGSRLGTWKKKPCLEMKDCKKQVMKCGKKQVKNDAKKQKIAPYARTSSKANEKSDSRPKEVDERWKIIVYFL